MIYCYYLKKSKWILKVTFYILILLIYIVFFLKLCLHSILLVFSININKHLFYTYYFYIYGRRNRKL